MIANFEEIESRRYRRQHDRQEAYEKARVLLDFPFFQNHVFVVLDERQKASINLFFSSIVKYFEHDGDYRHDLGNCLYSLRHIISNSRDSTEGNSAQSVNEMIGEINQYRAKSTAKWSDISRSYSLLKASFELS